MARGSVSRVQALPDYSRVAGGPGWLDLGYWAGLCAVVQASARSAVLSSSGVAEDGPIGLEGV